MSCEDLNCNSPNKWEHISYMPLGYRTFDNDQIIWNYFYFVIF